MRTKITPLRRLSPPEKAQVDKLYKHMALALLNTKEVMLARNQYVDQTIFDLLEAVQQDDALLLAAWTSWCATREMDGLRWPASQFHTELDVALANVMSFDVAKARILLQGGAR
jgi:hypothetical protein